QRKAIYSRRQDFLEGENLEETAWELIELVVAEVVGEHLDRRTAPDDWDTGEVAGWARRKFGIELDPEAIRTSGGAEGATEMIRSAIDAKIAESKEQIGEDDWKRTLRFLLLRAFDEKWKDHLRELDSLRQGIHLRGYAQVDPKQEYRREAGLMFGEMERAIAEQVTDSLFKIYVTEEMDDVLSGRWRPSQLTHDEVESFENTADTAPVGSTPEAPEPIKRSHPKVGRNDPCPCGSGKKVKKCHPEYLDE
ncbi:MAG: SEC-C metal-binding domain-containing protein, partial [Planctomycetota bacterium]